MIRLGSRGLQTTVCSLLAGAAIGACTDSETSLYIQGNIALIPPACIARPDSGAILLGEGLLDVAFSLEYTAALLVGNQLMPRGAKAQLRPEPMRLALGGAEIILTDLEGDLIEEGFSVPASGFVNPSASESPGFGVVFADLIPATVGSRLESQLRNAGLGSARTVIAEVRVFGTTLGGNEVESASFTYPIRVCYGCTVIFPLDAVTITPDGEVSCTQSAESVPLDVCRLGQDSGLDCRSCVATHPDVCLSPG